MLAAMALRDKLARRSVPYLEPGEQIQTVFLAQSGPYPYFILLAFIIILIGARYAVVVVTDRAIVILRAGVFTPTFPKRVVARLPRGTWLGDPSGLWGKIQLDRRFWVHKRFHKDVRAANQMLAAMYPAGPPPMQPPPPPYAPPPPGYGPPLPGYGPPQGAAPQYGPPPQQPYGAPPGQYGPPQ
jgi:hypothetical protein